MLLQNQVIKEIEKILGIQDLQIKESSKDHTVEKIIWNSLHIEIESLNDSLEYIRDLINSNLQEFETESNKIKQSYIIQRIVDTFIYTSILSSKTDADNHDKILNLKSLIKNLIALSTQTYEQRLCTSSFILLKDKTSPPSELLDSFEIDFIDFKTDTLKWEDLYKYTSALRLVDSLSISYVINDTYEIIGFARKRRNSKSIKEICINKIDDKFEYIYLEDKKIMWCLNKDKVFIFNNGEWKLKDYSVINSILKEFITANSTENLKKRDGNNTIVYLLEIIKDLSKNNTGSLFAFLGKNYFYNDEKKKISEYKDVTILNTMVKEENDERALYTKIIEREDKKMAINKATLDSYLLKLIADVDGAVIIDKNLKILGFGKMISPQNITEKNVKRLIAVEKNELKEFENEYSIEGGARSIATYEASTFGLAIKISEDGGITIFKRRKLIFKL